MRLLKSWSRPKLGLLSAACAVLSLFFLQWFIQTVWIASFPGAIQDGAAFRAYAQVACSFVFFVVAIYTAIRFWRNGSEGS